MPDIFTTANYDSPSFLNIAGHVLTLWLIIAVLVGLALLTLLCPSKIRTIGLKTRNYMVYNGMIRLILASILYFMLGGLLNFRYGINDTIFSIVNAVLSVLACISIVMFTCIVLFITIKN